MNYKAIIFDFDGVLSKDRFYEKALLPEYVNEYEWIQQNIFGNSTLIHKWMRNEITSNQINRFISENTRISFDILSQKFIESVRKMELDKGMKNLVNQKRVSNVKTAIVTDNMDIFSEITIDNHELDKIFEVIINSADHGLLKKDEDGKLFDIALEKLGENIGNTLLIDDSISAVDIYQQKGGRGFLYRNFDDLKSFLRLR